MNRYGGLRASFLFVEEVFLIKRHCKRAAPLDTSGLSPAFLFFWMSALRLLNSLLGLGFCRNLRFNSFPGNIW